VTLAAAGSGSPGGGEHVVELRSHLTEFPLAVDEKGDEIGRDPHHHILMWRPEYTSFPAVLVFHYRRWKTRGKVAASDR